MNSFNIPITSEIPLIKCDFVILEIVKWTPTKLEIDRNLEINVRKMENTTVDFLF